MSQQADLVWQGQGQKIVLSPRNGGRVVSWEFAGAERVNPLTLYEGGLLRVMFAEEQYPGSNYETPHQVVSAQTNADGFRVHLRHRWNAVSWFARAAGWPEKANELHADDLVLDKVLIFRAADAAIVCELSITNASDQRKILTPWIHSSLADWPDTCWVVANGQREEYNDAEIYWGSHLVRPGESVRLVHADKGRKVFGVLGASSDLLRGLSALLPIPGEFYQSPTELRGQTIELPPGQRWHSRFFLALTHDWQRWATASPAELFTRLEPAAAATDNARYADLLETWMLDDERRRGVMVLSFLDKPAFFSASRYAAAHSFAGFHADDGGAVAHVALYANRGGVVAAELSGDDRWTLQADAGPRARRATINFAPHDLVKLHLRGPADLAGRESVAVHLRLPDGSTQPLRIAEGATVEPRWPYQVRQAPRYMEQRFRERLGPPPEATADEIRAWQKKMRAKCRAYLELNADGPCDLAPRLVERQVGPTCVREKWLVQSEPGIWVPGYLIRPKSMTGRRPLLYQLHGSGPGKDGFAFDESETAVQTQFGHELEGMPYRVAIGLDCQVYVPDGRGQGEMGETNPAQWTTRMETLGLSNLHLRILDQVRALDWLLTRDDVDGSRIGSYGCSGGGQLTYWWASLDERVAVSLVSSTGSAAPVELLPDGYFDREFAPRVGGPGPLHGAPLGMLIAPRPMWIIDGKEDLGIDASKRAAWRERMQKGRDQIRAVYRGLGAEGRFEDTWFPAGHCAGVTVANVVAYFRGWFGT